MKIKVIVLRPSRRFELDINLDMSVRGIVHHICVYECKSICLFYSVCV